MKRILENPEIHFLDDDDGEAKWMKARHGDFNVDHIRIRKHTVTL